MRVDVGMLMLLICFVYGQSLMGGPTFSVGGDEVKNHYGAHYDLVSQDWVELPGKFKGKATAWEHVWLLKNRSGKPMSVGV